MTMTESDGSFIPAYADRWCTYCGFPFRFSARNRRYCQEYTQYADHGACERRYQRAQTTQGRRMRLEQSLRPDRGHTSPHAVAHGWMRQYFPDEDLREGESCDSVRPASRGGELRRPGATPEIVPAEGREEATDLLRRLLGVPLRTASGRSNVILAMSPPSVLVRTERSPNGKLVLIADLEAALSLLRREGSVMITPEAIGHRSSFLGAVLRTLPGTVLTGSPPRLTFAAGDGADQELSDADEKVTFEGDLGRGRTIEERREQAPLRRALFRNAASAACALCGETYPVRFLWAAHIKKRCACTEDERRDLSHIAMAACIFGCDALFEHGFISVDGDGVIIGLSDVDGVVARRIQELSGTRCSAFCPESAPYFGWHRQFFSG